jgi:hypothetical protein
MTTGTLRNLGRSGIYVTLGLLALMSCAAAQGYPSPYGPPRSYGPGPYGPPQSGPPQGYPVQSYSPQSVPPAGANGPPPPIQASASPGASPVCLRLEGQLAVMNNGSGDAARADAIRRAEDAVAKQQAELDRAVAQGHRQGCEGQGFLSLFSSLSPQCGPVTQHIQQIRGDLDRAMSDLEQLKSGSSSQDDQRRALIGQLAQNNCGAQYTAAANAEGGPRGFFDALFGGGTIVNPTGDGAPAGTFHTVCVRTCDGYYFPISYSTVPGRFGDDQRSCQRLCPAAEVSLYAFRNPGEDMNQAMSLNGQPYTALPTAFQYRKQFTPSCSCRRPGQSWADALKDADDSSTLESGDIIVTDKNAKALSQVPQAKTSARPGPGGGLQPDASAGGTATSAPVTSTPSDSTKRTIRTVGPPFVASH